MPHSEIYTLQLHLIRPPYLLYHVLLPSILRFDCLEKIQKLSTLYKVPGIHDDSNWAVTLHMLLSGCHPAAQASGARRAFVARLLAALVEGPLADDSRICAAFLAVECAPAVAEEQARGGDVLPAGGLETARAAAKRVLAVRRDSLALWGAYAELEAKAGNRKVGAPSAGVALKCVGLHPTSRLEPAAACGHL